MINGEFCHTHWFGHQCRLTDPVRRYTQSTFRRPKTNLLACYLQRLGFADRLWSEDASFLGFSTVISYH